MRCEASARSPPTHWPRCGDRQVKGLLVGYGSIGRRHLDNLHALGVRDWAVVRTGNSTLEFSPPGPVRSYSDLAAALGSEAPDFAVIANPSSLHVAATTACIEAGCAILVEKPLADRPDGLDELVALAEQRAAKILVGFQFRFHPAVLRMAQLVRDRTMGQPLHARVVWGEYLPSMHPWEDWRVGYAARADLGGGVHHTICHPFDYLRLIFGPPSVDSARLTTNGPLGLPVAEAADIGLSFAGGLTVALHLDYWARPSVHRVEIICADGTISWDYISGEFRIWDESVAQWRIEDLPAVDDRNNLFVAEAKHLLDVVRGDAPPVCTISDGVAAARLCFAAEHMSSAARDSHGSSAMGDKRFIRRS